MITVSRHTNPLEAHIVRGRLEAEGIPTVVMFEHHIWAMWSLSNALGGVRVWVPVQGYAAAQEVIKGISSGEYEGMLLGEHHISTAICPKCGSMNNAPHAWLWKVVLAVLFLTPFVLPYTTHLYSCDDCRHSWIASDQRPYPLYVIAVAIISIVIFLLSIFAALLFTFYKLSDRF